jgi:hypothetical protein
MPAETFKLIPNPVQFVDNCCAGVHPTVPLAPASRRATVYDGAKLNARPVITYTDPVNAFAEGGYSRRV